MAQVVIVVGTWHEIVTLPCWPGHLRVHLRLSQHLALTACNKYLRGNLKEASCIMETPGKLQGTAHLAQRGSDAKGVFLYLLSGASPRKCDREGGVRL